MKSQKFAKKLDFCDDVIIGPNTPLPLVINRHHLETPSPPLGDDVICERPLKYLEDNNILPDSQHGFRKGRSCLTQLIEHVDSVLKALNDGSEVDVIYLDYSKAFDKVDHETLLLKMRQYGIKGPIYNWIECFLKNRKQTVVVDGVKWGGVNDYFWRLLGTNGD